MMVSKTERRILQDRIDLMREALREISEGGGFMIMNRDEMMKKAADTLLEAFPDSRPTPEMMLEVSADLKKITGDKSVLEVIDRARAVLERMAKPEAPKPVSEW